MRTPKEVLQAEIDEMTRMYSKLLNHRKKISKAEIAQAAADRAKINARINEFQNAISKIL